MGVNLKELVDPIKKEITYSVLSNKVIALDAFNILYQFLSAIRQPDGTPLMDSQGNITSHLSGLFYRSISLMEQNIKLVYVFDGEKPKFKEEEIKRREEEKEKAKEKLKEALEKGEYEEAKKYAQGTAFITPEIIKESKELITAMGMAYVDAPSEGEAEAAYLSKIGKVYAAGSQDYDSLLFGAPILVRNIGITGKRKIPGSNQYKEISPEIIILEDVLKEYSLTQDQLISLAILVGTDYAVGGAEGIGVKKALEIVKIYKTPEKIFSSVQDKWKHDIDPLDIYEFFKNPPVKDENIRFGNVDEEKIKEILIDRHEFSKERVENALERLKKAKSKTAQKTLFG